MCHAQTHNWIGPKLRRVSTMSRVRRQMTPSRPHRSRAMRRLNLNYHNKHKHLMVAVMYGNIVSFSRARHQRVENDMLFGPHPCY